MRRSGVAEDAAHQPLLESDIVQRVPDEAGELDPVIDAAVQPRRQRARSGQGPAVRPVEPGLELLEQEQRSFGPKARQFREGLQELLAKTPRWLLAVEEQLLECPGKPLLRRALRRGTRCRRIRLPGRNPKQKPLLEIARLGRAVPAKKARELPGRVGAAQAVEERAAPL